MVSHLPICSCLPGTTGDPFVNCNYQIDERKLKIITQTIKIYQPALSLHSLINFSAPVSPCEPSPCGPNSQCRVNQDQAVCTCLQGFFGNPPNCKPECLVSAECNPRQACINQKCSDPCLGLCGIDAECRAINHSPICRCLEGQTGDPFVRCFSVQGNNETFRPLNFPTNFDGN